MARVVKTFQKYKIQHNISKIEINSKFKITCSTSKFAYISMQYKSFCKTFGFQCNWINIRSYKRSLIATCLIIVNKVDNSLKIRTLQTFQIIYRERMHTLLLHSIDPLNKTPEEDLNSAALTIPLMPQFMYAADILLGESLDA